MANKHPRRGTARVITPPLMPRSPGAAQYGETTVGTAMHLFWMLVAASVVVLVLSLVITYKLSRTKSTAFALAEAIVNSSDKSLGSRARKRQAKQVYKCAREAIDCLKALASEDNEVGNSAQRDLIQIQNAMIEIGTTPK